MSTGQIAWMALVIVLALIAAVAFQRLEKFGQDWLKLTQEKLGIDKKTATATQEQLEQQAKLNSMTLEEQANARRAQLALEAATAHRRAEEELRASSQRLTDEQAAIGVELTGFTANRHITTAADGGRYRGTVSVGASNGGGKHRISDTTDGSDRSKTSDSAASQDS